MVIQTTPTVTGYHGIKIPDHLEILFVNERMTVKIT